MDRTQNQSGEGVLTSSRSPVVKVNDAVRQHPNVEPGAAHGDSRQIPVGNIRWGPLRLIYRWRYYARRRQ